MTRSSIYISAVLFLSFSIQGLAQKKPVKAPAGYINPTTSSINNPGRKSIKNWKVLIDNAHVRNPNGQGHLPFLESYFVRKDLGDKLLLVEDSISSEAKRFKNPIEIGSIPKDDLILWNEFIRTEKGSRVLVLIENTQVQKANLEKELLSPSEGSNFAVCSLLKSKGDSLLVSPYNLFHVNEANKGYFWIHKKIGRVLNDRNFIISKREETKSLLKFHAQANASSTGFEISEKELHMGFIEVGRTRDWIELETVFSRKKLFIAEEQLGDSGGLERALLLHVDEVRPIMEFLTVLVGSSDYGVFKKNWKSFSPPNVFFNEKETLLELFETTNSIEFVKNDNANQKNYLKFNNLDSHFEELVEAFSISVKKLSSQRSRYGFRPYAGTYFFIGNNALPLNILLTPDVPKLQGRKTTKPKWDYKREEVNLESLDIFFIDLSQDIDNKVLKGAIASNFHTNISQVRLVPGSKELWVYHSVAGSDNKDISQKKSFSKEVASRFWEGDNPFNDKQSAKMMLRQHIYKRNIVDVGEIRYHFYVSSKFAKETSDEVSNNWILKDFVEECHFDFNAGETKVYLYQPNPGEEILKTFAEQDSMFVSELQKYIRSGKEKLEEARLSKQISYSVVNIDF